MRTKTGAQEMEDSVKKKSKLKIGEARRLLLQILLYSESLIFSIHYAGGKQHTVEHCDYTLSLVYMFSCYLLFHLHADLLLTDLSTQRNRYQMLIN